MDVEYIIVGQGICGTMLSWFLHKENKQFIVIDDANENTASKVAAGIINPVTGRRYAYTWMIDEIMPFALATYESMQLTLAIKLIKEKSIIDFFPTPQMLDAFVDRVSENDTYLHSYPDQNHFNSIFSYDFGCGEVRPSYLVDVQLLLDTWRKKLQKTNQFLTQQFNLDEVSFRTVIHYQDIRAEKIIFCDGITGMHNPWFRLLPFAPNKGEALIIHCPGLSNTHIYKKGLLLTPLTQPDTFWVGSNYQWEFDDLLPSIQFYNHATSVLNGWLKKPYQVMAHKAAIRPATLERKPFAGLHPHQPQIGILNGMGTKGTSLAPFFANQMVQYFLNGSPIEAAADVKRFAKILSRGREG